MGVTSGGNKRLCMNEFGNESDCINQAFVARQQYEKYVAKWRRAFWPFVQTERTCDGF